MTQKLLCVCAVCALLFVFASANIANAQETTTDGCPCGVAACPYKCFNPCCPPVSYRVGLFGVVRPVVYAPVYRPPVVYRPVLAPRYCYPVVCPPVTYCW